MRLADNHVGWEVQALTSKGWLACSEPRATRQDAELEMLAYPEIDKSLGLDPSEYRIYESLCHTK